MKQQKYSNYIAAGVTAVLVIAIGLLMFFAMYHFDAVKNFFSGVSRILRPVSYGLVLAFLLLPVQRRIFGVLTAMTPDAKLKDCHNLNFLNLIAVLFCLITAAFVIYVLMAMLIPQIYFSIVGFIQALPEYLGGFHAWFLNFLHENPGVEEALLPYYNSVAASFEQWMQSEMMPHLESVSSTINWLRTSIMPSLTSVATNLYTVVFATIDLAMDLLIAVIVSVYLLVRKDVMAARAKKIIYSLCPTNWADLIVEETRNAYKILNGFIIGKIIDSIIIGIICFICCKIFTFPYPALVATVIGVTNVIPFFGPFIGAVPCSILILIVSPIQCLYFVIFILVLQQFDGNILGPKILGDSTGLDAFWVLFSILLFGGLFGFTGMVLGVPIFAMFYRLINRLVRYGLTQRGLPLETEDYLGKTDAMQKKIEE